METSLSQMVLESGAMINSMHGNCVTFDVVRQLRENFAKLEMRSDSVPCSMLWKACRLGIFQQDHYPSIRNYWAKGLHVPVVSCTVDHMTQCWVAETAEVNANNKVWREETLDIQYNIGRISWLSKKSFMVASSGACYHHLVGVHYIHMAAKSLAEMWILWIFSWPLKALAPLFNTANLNIGLGKPIQKTSITKILEILTNSRWKPPTVAGPTCWSPTSRLSGCENSHVTFQGHSTKTMRDSVS